jgi:signal transduction histidine kinase
MSEPQSLFQLSRQILGTARERQPAPEIVRYLGEHWQAACWLWQGKELAVYDPQDHLADLLDPEPTMPPILAGWQVIWVAGTQGYVALAQQQAWSESDRQQLQELHEFIEVVLGQAELQRQADIAKQSARQVQALVDERTAQLRSSQTLLSKLQDAGRRRIQQLDEANRLKDEFISTISHELRTPLTSMSLAITMLRKPGIDETRQERYLGILEEQCAQEINLINNLLTLQKIESKQASTDRQPVMLEQLLQPLTEQFASTWNSKNLQLIVQLPAPFRWETDPESVSRILQELLANAGKFAQPDTIVELQGQVMGKQLRMRIIDRGRGIDPAEQQYIFEKFRRGAGVTKQAIGGTGLGLALVKSLVQHLQGEISVTSKGEDPLAEVCFEVLLPLQEEP